MIIVFGFTASELLSITSFTFTVYNTISELIDDLKQEEYFKEVIRTQEDLIKGQQEIIDSQRETQVDVDSLQRSVDKFVRRPPLSPSGFIRKDVNINVDQEIIVDELSIKLRKPSKHCNTAEILVRDQAEQIAFWRCVDQPLKLKGSIFHYSILIEKLRKRLFKLTIIKAYPEDLRF